MVEGSQEELGGIESVLSSRFSYDFLAERATEVALTLDADLVDLRGEKLRKRGGESCRGRITLTAADASLDLSLQLSSSPESIQMSPSGTDCSE